MMFGLEELGLFLLGSTLTFFSSKYGVPSIGRRRRNVAKSATVKQDQQPQGGTDEKPDNPAEVPPK